MATDRSLSASIASALDPTSGFLTVPVIFVEIALKTTPVYYHTDLGSITSVSPAQTWTGTSGLAAITEGITETDQFEANPFRAILSGVVQSVIDVAQDPAEYANRPFKVYVSALDTTTGALVDTTLHLVKQGYISSMGLAVANGESAITVTGEDEHMALKRSANLFLTHEEQDRTHSGDLGFEYAHLMANYRVQWGAKEGSLSDLDGGASNPGTYEGELRPF